VRSMRVALWWVPVQDGVGVGRIADELMPVFHGDLAGHDRGATPIAVFQDLQQVVTGGSV
jgi:hypothetical protein